MFEQSCNQGQPDGTAQPNGPEICMILLYNNINSVEVTH